jgi:hypothetical protein
MPHTYPVPVVPGFLAGPWRWWVAPLMGLALSMGFVPEVPAATTWTVCADGCDYSSIKAAIAASSTLEGDTLAIGAGTYTEPGITVTKSLTLQGEDAATTTVQAAEAPDTASDRVFTIPSGVTVTLRELTIRYGLARNYHGGGLYNAGTLTLTHSTIRNNKAIGYYGGGGLVNDSQGTLTLIRSTINGNTARFGGGLFNAGLLTLADSTVRDNKAPKASGGGLVNDSQGTLTLIRSTINGNTAGFGGGLANWGLLTLTESTISGNTATHGGGLWTSSEVTLTLTQSTISGNTAAAEGGGLFNYGPLTLTQSTISGNTATSGGGLYHNHGRLTLSSSLVAQNPDGSDCLITQGSVTSHGYNLDSDGSCELTASTDRPGVDPLLGPLQDNGGPTFTHALLPGSPARDAIPWGAQGCGTTKISDQRGQARPDASGGACDIGAYEVEAPGQALGGWVSGLTPRTVTCKNLSSGQVVTLSTPAAPWNCEAAGLQVPAGALVAILVRGPVKQGATDVGGAVVGMQPSSGGCMNLTTGQQVPFEHMVGTTAGSCVTAGLVIHPKDTVQIHVQGVAE